MALTENEIRPDALMVQQAQCFENDVKRLMAHQADFVRVNCPACDRDDAEYAFQKFGMDYETCNHCGTIYANARPRPEHLEDYYTNSENYAFWNTHIFPASEPARRQKIFLPRVERVLEICRRYNLPTQTLLEVGAGFGIFCEEMAKKGVFQRIIGVEPTPGLAETCRKRGIEIVEKLVEQIHRDEVLAADERIDVLANFEVIEHLFSPRDFLLQCGNLMEQGAVLVLTCPNGQGFDVIVMKELSSAVDVEHINLFNPQSLSMLLENCGFEVIEVQTPGELDAELVRKKILSGEFDVSAQPFLKQLLIDRWEETGASFQQFLKDNQLSSNMMLIARKR